VVPLRRLTSVGRFFFVHTKAHKYEPMRTLHMWDFVPFFLIPVLLSPVEFFVSVLLSRLKIPREQSLAGSSPAPGISFPEERPPTGRNAPSEETYQQGRTSLLPGEAMLRSFSPLVFWLCFPTSVFLCGCLPAFRASECEPNPAQALLGEINRVRRDEGIPPVWPNLLLAKAAEGHAVALSRGEAEGHFGADGSDPLTRIRASGYLPVAFGETIAIGSTAPNLVIEAWLRSPTHRAVLLDPSVDEVGLGGFLEIDEPIWVADFGKGREPGRTRCHPWRTR
jgi:uncharacterized protein YkwD